MSEPQYARVVVDVPLLHLDRLFDYSVPDELRSAAVPGARVRVRFAGRKVLGFIHSLTDQAERPERVLPLLDVLGPAVVTEDTFRLTREVADRWVGSWADVLRSAVPARHARAESQVTALLPDAPIELPSLEPSRAALWNNYESGADIVATLARDPSEVRAALLVTCGDDPFDLALDAVLAAGGGAIVVVPDQALLDRLEAAASRRMPKGSWVRLSADLGPAARYRNYLEVVRGEATVVFGTRSAVFAPVSPLKAVIVLNDGDDSLAEQHAPGWHAREVSVLAAVQARSGWLSISSSRSVEVQQWVESGWAKNVSATREQYRALAPVVRATSDADLARDPLARSARLPAIVFGTLRDGLANGPVLISVPRRGYQLHLVCDTCRNPARCAECKGPLQRDSATDAPNCMWCGTKARTHTCSWCNASTLRSIAVGAARTAEEIGRAFPGIAVYRSGGETVLRQIPNAPAIVIATPGAEPWVEDGHFRAAAILDAESVLHRSDLRSEEEAFRRWQDIVALVAPKDGRVVIAGDDSHPVIQALIRRDPIAFAHRLLVERTEAAMPPAAAVFELVMTPGVWIAPTLTQDARILGPVTMRRGNEAVERVLITCPRKSAPSVAKELRAWLGLRSASKAQGSVGVYVDPTHLA